MRTIEFWEKIFNFNNYFELLPLVTNSLIIGFFLGIMSGLIGIFIITRNLSFAVHGISELSFAGAAFALLVGANIITGGILGSIFAALIFGIFEITNRKNNSTVGIIMPFGLGLGILFLSLYEGRTANKFSLLTGQIIAVSDTQVAILTVITIFVSIVLLFLWRPLMFSSLDKEIARSRGIPQKTITILFMLILGVAVAVSVQIIGALLVLSLLVTPAAAAAKITKSPTKMVILSTIFALVAIIGGILLSLGASIPVSPYITTIAFLIYMMAVLLKKINIFN